MNNLDIIIIGCTIIITVYIIRQLTIAIKELKELTGLDFSHIGLKRKKKRSCLLLHKWSIIDDDVNAPIRICFKCGKIQYGVVNYAYPEYINNKYFWYTKNEN